MTAVAQVCDPDLFKNIDPENQTNCESCATNLRTLTDGLSTVLLYCVDFFFDSNCTDLFQEVVTEEGICFTYNAITYYRNDTVDEHIAWTLEDGYIENDVPLTESHPRKGSKQTLVLILQSETWNYDFTSKGPLQGYKVFLHLPNEAPQTLKNYYLIPQQQSVHLSIVPKLTLMSSELRYYPVDKRRCYFNSERYLRFFKYYTQNNCESDCVANLTLSRCGCLRFHMPSKYLNFVSLRV
jgi:acid-sensing ion channel, other